jgi:putative alpha-1,2-mannosidase
MQARNSDGTWADPNAGWTEGNTWVYTWAVMQDIPGLMNLMGGKDSLQRETRRTLQRKSQYPQK